MENFKDRLFQLRRHLGFNQEEMASKVGKSTPAWQSYERGISFPGGEVFRELHALGFNINWLLSGRGEMQLNPTEASSSYQSQDDIDDKFNEIIDEIETKILMQAHNNLFWDVFKEYGQLNPAHAGWCQMEIIMRFPEFRRWVRKNYGIDKEKDKKKTLQEFIDYKQSLIGN